MRLTAGAVGAVQRGMLRTRSKPLSRSKTLKAACMCLLLLTTGCRTVAPKPPVWIAPNRPPLTDEDLCTREPEWCRWLGDLIEAYVRDCVALATMRSEDFRECEVH